MDDFFSTSDKLYECINILNESIVDLLLEKGWNQEIDLFSYKLDEYSRYN